MENIFNITHKKAYLMKFNSRIMKKLLIILLFGFCPILGMSQSGCHVFGKIKFVDYGQDYKVKFVDYGEDLKIKYVNYGEKNVGKWKSVNYGEDYKIKVVSYGEDFKVKMVKYGQGCD